MAGWVLQREQGVCWCHIGVIGTIQEQVPVFSFETLRDIMEGQGFKLVAQEEMPFLIREHVRKYQWGCSHATVWRRCS